MSKWYEQSTVKMLRCSVAEHLEEQGLLLPSKDKNESAAAFWERVDKAGLSVKAVELYDQFDAENAEWVHRSRETKKAFADRIEREGRQVEVEEERKKLLESGFSSREIHVKLVYQFQPLDGSHTRPWETPDPWAAGRFFRKKEDQSKFLAEQQKDDSYCPSSKWRYEWEQMRQKEHFASKNAKWLVDCAKWRREERVALANARRRARELKAAAAEEAKLAEAKAKEAAAQAKGQKKAKNQKKALAVEEEPKIHGKWIVVKTPSGSLENQWVPEAKN
jgi:hypothetical protein